MINPRSADGNESFVACFDHTAQFVKANLSTKDLSVMFFTDGCDTINNPQ